MASLSSHVEAARSALLSEDYDATARLCLRILDRFPRHVETYALLAEAYRELGWRDEAEDLFRRVVSADPEHLVARWGLSLLCEARGDMAQAVSHLQVAVDLAPAVPALKPELRRLTGASGDSQQPTPAGLARIWANCGLAERALHAYDRVLVAQPFRLDVQVALAETLWRLREHDLAVQVARRALADSPDCLKANLIVGRALELDGRTDEAQPYYDRADALDPEGNLRLDLFAGEGASLREVALPDPEAPLVAVPEPAVDWQSLPLEAEPSAASPTPERLTPSLRPEPTDGRLPAAADPSVPDNWMQIDDRELDMAPAEVVMASEEELAAFEASLSAEAAAPPAPSRAPTPQAAPATALPPEPIPLRPNQPTPIGQRPAASLVPPPEEFEETPVEDWLEPTPIRTPEPPAPTPITAAAPPAPTPIAAARAAPPPPPPPAFNGAIEAPAPAPTVLPDLPEDSEWSSLLHEEIEMDDDQQARLRAALLDAGLMPPEKAAKAPPAVARPLRELPRSPD